MKIGIAGVGGIGSNVAVHLVRSGVRSLKLVDFDCVDACNLNRQFYFEDQIGQPKVAMLEDNLKRIDSHIHIETLALKLDQANLAATFSDCPIVVEGFDGDADKKMLLEALAVTGQFVVSASGVAGSQMDAVATRRMGCCTIIGDFQTDCRRADLYSHKVGAVAAMMAGEVLKRIADEQDRN